MNPAHTDFELSGLRRENRRQRWLNALLAAGLLLALLAVLLLIGRERVIVLPPSLEKGFWISGRSVSASYLEQMAYYAAALQLNVGPASIDYQCKLFMELVDPSPDTWNRLKADCAILGKKLQRDGVSTVFNPKSVQVDEQALKVVFDAYISTYVGLKKTSEVFRSYAIGYRINRFGRLGIVDFHETKASHDQNPAAAGADPR